MKSRFFTCGRIGIFFLTSVCSWAGTTPWAGITNVSIVPPEPAISDSIIIQVSGWEGYHPVWVEKLDFRVDGNKLELDLSVNTGLLPQITTWTYYENIGCLPSGVYDLEVNAIYTPTFTETVSIVFEVVPEPASLLLLMAGIPLLRGKNKRS